MFNSYGSRRGNDRVMTRGTFANTRIAELGPWPQLDANLAAGLQNTALNTASDLFSFDDLALSIGISLAQTIFDGGAIDARIKIASSQERQALERYGQTIINAYGDIVASIDLVVNVCAVAPTKLTSPILVHAPGMDALDSTATK